MLLYYINYIILIQLKGRKNPAAVNRIYLQLTENCRDCCHRLHKGRWLGKIEHLKGWHLWQNSCFCTWNVPGPILCVSSLEMKKLQGVNKIFLCPKPCRGSQLQQICDLVQYKATSSIQMYMIKLHSSRCSLNRTVAPVCVCKTFTKRPESVFQEGLQGCKSTENSAEGLEH